VANVDFSESETPADTGATVACVIDEQAKGVIMGRLRCSAEQAGRLLARVAHDTGISVRAAALSLVDVGTRVAMLDLIALVQNVPST
jgi:hypothetical protein